MGGSYYLRLNTRMIQQCHPAPDCEKQESQDILYILSAVCMYTAVLVHEYMDASIREVTSRGVFSFFVYCSIRCDMFAVITLLPPRWLFENQDPGATYSSIWVSR